MLDCLDVDVVLHCGDVGSAEIVAMFANWPTHFVFGNCDDATELQPAIVQANQTCHDRFGDLQFEGTRLALLHSDDRRLFRTSVDGGEFDVVCYGHTHIAEIRRQSKTLLINPGALYRAHPHSIAVLDLPSLEASIVEL